MRCDIEKTIRSVYIPDLFTERKGEVFIRKHVHAAVQDSSRVDVNDKINNNFMVNKPATKQTVLPIQAGKTPKEKCQNAYDRH